MCNNAKEYKYYRGDSADKDMHNIIRVTKAGQVMVMLSNTTGDGHAQQGMVMHSNTFITHEHLGWDSNP